MRETVTSHSPSSARRHSGLGGGPITPVTVQPCRPSSKSSSSTMSDWADTTARLDSMPSANAMYVRMVRLPRGSERPARCPPELHTVCHGSRRRGRLPGRTLQKGRERRPRALLRYGHAPGGPPDPGSGTSPPEPASGPELPAGGPSDAEIRAAAAVAGGHRVSAPGPQPDLPAAGAERGRSPARPRVDFWEVLYKRRTTRRFDPARPVPR